MANAAGASIRNATRNLAIRRIDVDAGDRSMMRLTRFLTFRGDCNSKDSPIFINLSLAEELCLPFFISFAFFLLPFSDFSQGIFDPIFRNLALP